MELLDSLKKWLTSWTLRPLNLVSILVLVKSILQAMLTYLFSTLVAPKSMLKEIRNLQWEFLWTNTNEKKK